MNFTRLASAVAKVSQYDILFIIATFRKKALIFPGFFYFVVGCYQKQIHLNLVFLI